MNINLAVKEALPDRIRMDIRELSKHKTTPLAGQPQSQC